VDKVVLNFDGGINNYTALFIAKEENVGSHDKTMFMEVSSPEHGRSIEHFLQSDIARFLFLITQYASGMRTQNEPLVANSITIPPADVTDYYAFFGLEKYKPFIEKLLADYVTFKAPKRKEAKGGAPATPRNKPGPNATRRRVSK
jgi:hypothetical protein